MSLDDNAKTQSEQDAADQLARIYRSKERVLALLLAFLTTGTSVVYIFTLRNMGGLLLGVMVASEFLVMLAVYVVIVKRWRRDRRR